MRIAVSLFFPAFSAFFFFSRFAAHRYARSFEAYHGSRLIAPCWRRTFDTIPLLYFQLSTYVVPLAFAVGDDTGTLMRRNGASHDESKVHD